MSVSSVVDDNAEYVVLWEVGDPPLGLVHLTADGRLLDEQGKLIEPKAALSPERRPA